jgi:hydroxymethylpyrimidine pyrophosphatase-like HAD family hydrolase
MLIALDYDKTYTADPALWDDFIQSAKDRGHTVKIVTMRRPDEVIEYAPVDVIYTSRKAKAVVVNADIWIDDSPAWIFQDSI